MTVTLPQEKLDEVLDECMVCKEKETASRKQIQNLADKLQHVAKCVKPVTRFMNRVLSALRASPPMGPHVFSPLLGRTLTGLLSLPRSATKLCCFPQLL